MFEYYCVHWNRHKNIRLTYVQCFFCWMCFPRFSRNSPIDSVLSEVLCSVRRHIWPFCLARVGEESHTGGLCLLLSQPAKYGPFSKVILETVSSLFSLRRLFSIYDGNFYSNMRNQTVSSGLPGEEPFLIVLLEDTSEIRSSIGQESTEGYWRRQQ